MYRRKHKHWLHQNHMEKTKIICSIRTNQPRVFQLRLLQFLLLFLLVGLGVMIFSMNIIRYFGVQSVVPAPQSHFQQFRRSPSCSWQESHCHWHLYERDSSRATRGYIQYMFILCHLMILIFQLHRFSTRHEFLARLWQRAIFNLSQTRQNLVCDKKLGISMIAHVG